jgi:chromosome segregation ATPase
MVDPSLRGTMGALGALGGGVTGVTGRDVPFFALIPRLEGHLRSAEAECETLRLERDDMRAALAASSEETAAAERAHRDAEALATERLVTLRQTEAELEQTVDRLRNSQEALALVDEQVETMEERLADSQALPRQLKNLQLRFEGTEAKNVALEAELLKTLEELRAAQEVMKTMLPESRYGQLLRDVEHLRKQNNRLNGSYAVLLGKFEAAERDMERSREVQRAMSPRRRPARPRR